MGSTSAIVHTFSGDGAYAQNCDGLHTVRVWEICGNGHRTPSIPWELTSAGVEDIVHIPSRHQIQRGGGRSPEFLSTTHTNTIHLDKEITVTFSDTDFATNTRASRDFLTGKRAGVQPLAIVVVLEPLRGVGDGKSDTNGERNAWISSGDATPSCLQHILLFGTDACLLTYTCYIHTE